MISIPFFVTLLVLTNPVKAANEHRPKIIAGYQPVSSMALANIDLDHAEMVEHLAEGTAISFKNAKRVYEQGANAKPYAQLSLDIPLEHPLTNGMNMAGLTPDGSYVAGTVFGNYPEGATEIGFLYDGSAKACAVGASMIPRLVGCLIPSGKLTIEGYHAQLDYTYNPSKDNLSRLSLQKLSSKAKEKMNECEYCPFDLYMRYVDYYGNYSYADEWVQAAFEERKTDFKNGDGNFKHYEYAGRAELIKKGTVLLHVWMSVQSELNDAIVNCHEGCVYGNECNEEAVHSWDVAVGWYTGSLEGSNFLGSGSGRFLHKVADKRCIAFNTCDSMTGLSNANDELFQLFHSGQRKIRLGQCSVAEGIKQRISNLMVAPLIQETLWHAHITDYKPKDVLEQTDAAEIISAGAATSAASILPLVHFCDPNAASVVYNNLKTGHDASFFKVKDALESTYDCLGITCMDVGGLYNGKEASYLEGAEPCGSVVDQAQAVSSRSQSAEFSDLDICLIVFGSIVGCLVLIAISYKVSGYVHNPEKILKQPPARAFEVDLGEEQEETFGDDAELQVEQGEVA